MSFGIYPEFELPLEGTQFEAGGEVLAAYYESLDIIARLAKLTPMTAFADNRPIPEDFDGNPDELAEVMGEWDEWFDATQGQAAMQGLADHIKGNLKAAIQFDESAEVVVEELEELARVLEAAAKQGVQFRLQLG